MAVEDRTNGREESSIKTAPAGTFPFTSFANLGNYVPNLSLIRQLPEHAIAALPPRSKFTYVTTTAAGEVDIPVRLANKAVAKIDMAPTQQSLR